ncbi:MAG: NAD(P)/FAD-dependent oxidoreductase [Bacteroidales bacterium]|nr:NAD(P)/FAD-dependent oxidoreductase [Bacteroidales bacterium]MDD4670990.1 NAD(P)/FAD-dependent oxidoreductase [Bacteroidales bacterium]
MNESVTIIGGGLGGLICGAILGKEGYRVRVLERHRVAGGGLHMFMRDGISFETGLHYIGGFEQGGMLRQLFTYLGIMDEMKYKNLEEDAFDVLYINSDGKQYHFGKGKEHFIEVLSSQFPEEEKAIRGYINAIYDICEKVPFNRFKMPDQALLMHTFSGYDISIDEFISSFTSNPKLQAVLAWNSTMYNGRKGETPVFVAALTTKMYIEGAARLIGGGEQIARALSGVIVNNGGEILVNKEVTDITIDNGKVRSVTTSDGERYSSDIFISSIHPRKMVDISTQGAFSKAFRVRVDSIRSSDSAFTIFVELKKKSFPYLNYSVLYYDDYSDILSGVSSNDGDFPRQMIVMTLPETYDDVWARKMIILCPMLYETVSKWENSSVGHRGDDYLKFKNNCCDKVMKKLKTIYPDIDNAIDKYFSASPLTIRDYLGSPDGAIYGRIFDCKEYEISYMSPKTKIANLYLTGQNVRLHGICGVPMTALETCSYIIGMQQLINKINSRN